jgi:hypothetical protein
LPACQQASKQTKNASRLRKHVQKVSLFAFANMAGESKTRSTRGVRGSGNTNISLARRLVPWLAFLLVLTMVLGLIYGFHMYGDETLCPDRQSLIKRVTALQQEVDVLHSRHSDEKQGWIAGGGQVLPGANVAAAAATTGGESAVGFGGNGANQLVGV